MLPVFFFAVQSIQRYISDLLVRWDMRGVRMKSVYALILVAVLLAACSGTKEGSTVISGANQDEFGNDIYPILTQQSTFYVEGSSARETHQVRFTDWSGALKYKDGQLAGASMVIDATSLSTGIDGLDTELHGARLLHTALAPVITLESSEIVTTAEGGKAFRTELTLRGISKIILVPFEATEHGVKGDFLLDVSDFGVNYLGVSNQVRVVFDVQS